MNKKKFNRIPTSLNLDKELYDKLSCPECTIKLTPFVNAKLHEYFNSINQPITELKNVNKDVVNFNNSIIDNEIEDLLKSQPTEWKKFLFGRTRKLKMRGIDLTNIELQRKIEERLKKNVPTLTQNKG